ncbi:hypothetical protein EBZ39_07680 [bacterium]|nr:hypothetical protein [bacterium]
MNKETVKILVAVLRVFVAGANKGYDSALHAAEVTAQVCRDMHRRKEKEKKNTHGYVITALRVLKAKRILFEAIDNWADDKLKRFKPSENKRVFGLTKPALEHLKEIGTVENFSPLGESTLMSVLQKFDVIPARKEASITVPAVLVETVKEIERKESQKETTIMPAQNASQTPNNIQRLIATVRNRSETWGGQTGTPADFLGAMFAIYLADGNGPETPISAKKLNFGWNNYAACREFLRQNGLVENFAERENPYGKNKIRAYGLKLTSLGLEVAYEGDFKDERTSSTNKTGPMIKNQKKEQPVENGSETLNAQQLAEMLAEMRQMRDEIDALRAGKAAQPQPVENVPPPVEYSDMDTISLLLTTAIPGFIGAIKELLNDKYGLESGGLKPGGTITAINTRGLYLGLTEIEKTFSGIKGYVSQCLHTGAPVDMELLTRYAEDYIHAADNLKVKKTLPALADSRVMTKCVLRKSEAIRHPVWRRSVAAQN